MSESSPLPWSSPGWLPAVRRWIDDALGARGNNRTGALNPFHVRPWSTVVRVPTTAGDVYFKATASSLGHEAALTAALARWAPNLIVSVLAVDPDRSWLLLADAGDVLRSRIPTPADLHHWHQVLPRYAALQQKLALRVDELLALGVPDRRLTRLPTLYKQLLDEEPLLSGQPEGLAAQEQRQLVALTPHLRAACDRLLAFDIPETLYNEDFHDNNVFVRDGHAQDARYLLCDWGDGAISHPFFSMLINLRSPAYRLQLPADHPALLSMRVVYLDAWSAFLDRERLLVAFRLARWLALVSRALTWQRVLAPVPPTLSREYTPYLRRTLRDLRAQTPHDLL